MELADQQEDCAGAKPTLALEPSCQTWPIATLEAIANPHASRESRSCPWSRCYAIGIRVDIASIAVVDLLCSDVLWSRAQASASSGSEITELANLFGEDAPFIYFQLSLDKAINLSAPSLIRYYLPQVPRQDDANGHENDFPRNDDAYVSTYSTGYLTTDGRLGRGCRRLADVN